MQKRRLAPVEQALEANDIAQITVAVAVEIRVFAARGHRLTGPTDLNDKPRPVGAASASIYGEVFRFPSC